MSTIDDIYDFSQINYSSEEKWNHELCLVLGQQISQILKHSPIGFEYESGAYLYEDNRGETCDQSEWLFHNKERESKWFYTRTLEEYGDITKYRNEFCCAMDVLAGLHGKFRVNLETVDFLKAAVSDSSNMFYKNLMLYNTLVIHEERLVGCPENHFISSSEEMDWSQNFTDEHIDKLPNQGRGKFGKESDVLSHSDGAIFALWATKDIVDAGPISESNLTSSFELDRYTDLIKINNIDVIVYNDSDNSDYKELDANHVQIQFEIGGLIFDRKPSPNEIFPVVGMPYSPVRIRVTISDEDIDHTIYNRVSVRITTKFSYLWNSARQQIVNIIATWLGYGSGISDLLPEDLQQES